MKRGRLEDPDELKRRIDEASKFVPLDQLALSPQCGFSSTIEGNVLNPHREVDKLRLVINVPGTCGAAPDTTARTPAARDDRVGTVCQTGNVPSPDANAGNISAAGAQRD